ncbi:MAG: hypothetical protein IJ447_09125, partial [Clostridia bacterium]|nr:hypothetical protein [Clostridia bacterium]
LEFCLRESLDNIRLLGVHSSLKSKCSGSLYFENAVAVYDLFEKTVELFIDDINALMVSLKCENSVIKLTLQIGLNDGADTSALNTLSLANGSVTCDVDENDVAVYILLSEGGASDD